MSRTYYPAFINLAGKQCVVVGGGKIAERKVLSLIRAGANVKVISPAITTILERKKRQGAILHVKRRIRSGDLCGAFLVIAATSDERVNKKVSDEAPCLINVVDVPRLANFIVPATLRRGHLTIAVSTSGASPSMAKAIKRELKLLYTREFSAFVRFLDTVRRRALREISDKKARTRFLKDISSQAIIAALRTRGFRAVKEEILHRENRHREKPARNKDMSDY